MKRKYYLRGLGFGILITALVFIVAGPSELSDEEIIKRAEKLGYSKEESSLGIKDLLGTGTPVPTKTPSPSEQEPETNTPIPTPTLVPTTEPEIAPTTVPTPTKEPLPTNTPLPTTTPTSTPVPTNTPVPTATNTPIPTEKPTVDVITAEITVIRGESAGMVCRKIEEAGILKNGDDFRDYLVRQNLSDYINVGTYILSSDMSYKEMAKLLTGR